MRAIRITIEYQGKPKEDPREDKGKSEAMLAQDVRSIRTLRNVAVEVPLWANWVGKMPSSLVWLSR